MKMTEGYTKIKFNLYIFELAEFWMNFDFKVICPSYLQKPKPEFSMEWRFPWSKAILWKLFPPHV